MNLHIHGHVLPEDKEQDIYVVNGHITFQKVKDAKTVVKDGYILPGLVDSHAHLSLASPAGDEAPPEERVRASARAHLHAMRIVELQNVPVWIMDCEGIFSPRLLARRTLY